MAQRVPSFSESFFSKFSRRDPDQFALRSCDPADFAPRDRTESHFHIEHASESAAAIGYMMVDARADAHIRGDSPNF
jgi:hypothetical protein